MSSLTVRRRHLALHPFPTRRSSDLIGNLMIRWRGPLTVAYGDQVQATGKLMLPRDLPTFDRRAYLAQRQAYLDRKSTRLNSSHTVSSYAVFCSKKKTTCAFAKASVS